MASKGVLHTYAPGLVAYEHHPSSSSLSSDDNKLLFIGGLGDGLFTVLYIQHLLTLSNWAVVEIITSSSYKGWGTGSIKRDVEEIAKAVQYFRNLNPDGKIVLFGHSTGSQDTMQYLLDMAAGNVPGIDGGVMQAPVSDREAIVMTTSKTSYLTSLNFCESFIKDGRGHEVLPCEMRPGFEDTPISAERWWALAAPLDKEGRPQGKDDFFSSDLKDPTLRNTFGRIPKNIPVLALYSEKDEFVPKEVDKEKLLARWREQAENENFKAELVVGASHSLQGAEEEVMMGFVERVKAFLGEVA